MCHTTIWRKRDVPPSVTSKNTIGFLSDASAIVGAVQAGCSRADGENKSRLMTLVDRYTGQQGGISPPSSKHTKLEFDQMHTWGRRKPEPVHAEDLERAKIGAAAGNA